jgi:hypothetical protein
LRQDTRRGRLAGSRGGLQVNQQRGLLLLQLARLALELADRARLGARLRLGAAHAKPRAHRQAAGGIGRSRTAPRTARASALTGRAALVKRSRREVPRQQHPEF